MHRGLLFLVKQNACCVNFKISTKIVYLKVKKIRTQKFFFFTFFPLCGRLIPAIAFVNCRLLRQLQKWYFSYYTAISFSHKTRMSSFIHSNSCRSIKCTFFCSPTFGFPFPWSCQNLCCVVSFWKNNNGEGEGRDKERQKETGSDGKEKQQKWKKEMNRKWKDWILPCIETLYTTFLWSDVTKIVPLEVTTTPRGPWTVHSVDTSPKVI